VIAFAVAPEAVRFVTLGYSYRLLRNFGPPDDWRAGFDAVTAPIEIIAGADDELLKVDEYAKMVGADQDRTRVTIVPGADHLGVLRQPAALAAIVAATTR
jgi:pimeloyl-ACP methyl ester carboxylesterase